jgi:hypothetical protein
MPDTPNLALPLIEAAQAQKHVTHNEALLRLDAQVQLAVKSRALAAPPATPADGDRYLVAASPTGAWSGHAGEIAYREAGVWRFAAPKAGWRLWVEAEAVFLVFDGAAWIDLQAIDELQNMDMIGVNTTADTVNRLAVSSAAALFTHAGAGVQIKVNKNAASDTASLLFQNGFSGRAEMGLAGDDDFRVKVSANGSGWIDAITVNRTTGVVTVTPNSITNAALSDMAAATIKGALSAGDPQDLTAAQATSLLNTFTPALKGLVPPSGGGTTNYLRADGSWAPPPGGGGGGAGDVLGPASAADTAIARFDGTTGKLIQNSGVLVSDDNEIDLPVQSAPTAPVADRLKLFAGKRGGRLLQRIMGPTNLATFLQPHFGFSTIASWQAAGNSTAISAIGAAALVATGTATASNVANTNLHSMMRRIDYLVTTAATTAVAGFRSAAAQYLVGGPAADLGGFYFTCRWGPATGVATATNRAFVGMGSSTAAPTDVEPSSIANIVGMGWDTADANIQFMHRGSGAVTKIDLGGAFAVPTADRSKVYELTMFSPPGTPQTLHYEVRELGTSNAASGTVSANLPTASTLLAPRGWMSVGGTSSVIGIALMNLYIETDF